jgi:hypothetical protein
MLMENFDFYILCDVLVLPILFDLWIWGPHGWVLIFCSDPFGFLILYARNLARPSRFSSKALGLSVLWASSKPRRRLCAARSWLLPNRAASAEFLAAIFDRSSAPPSSECFASLIFARRRTAPCSVFDFLGWSSPPGAGCSPEGAALRRRRPGLDFFEVSLGFAFLGCLPKRRRFPEFLAGR